MHLHQEVAGHLGPIEQESDARLRLGALFLRRDLPRHGDVNRGYRRAGPGHQIDGEGVGREPPDGQQQHEQHELGQRSAPSQSDGPRTHRYHEDSGGGADQRRPNHGRYQNSLGGFAALETILQQHGQLPGARDHAPPR